MFVKIANGDYRIDNDTCREEFPKITHEMKDDFNKLGYVIVRLHDCKLCELYYTFLEMHSRVK